VPANIEAKVLPLGEVMLVEGVEIGFSHVRESNWEHKETIVI